MQHQKTIAKWIAVIVLTTLCIASYLVINAIETDKFSNNQNSANAQDTPTLDNSVKPSEEVLPTYSTLPREGYKIENSSVSHVGSSGNDTYLSCVVLHDRLYVFFDSDKGDFDVKKSGVHIAIFEKNSVSNAFDLLIAAQFIIDETHNFLCASICSNGIFAIFSNSTSSTALIIDKDGKISAKNTLEHYTVAKAYLQNDEIYLFASDKNALHFLKIKSDLQFEKSNFLYSTSAHEIDEIFPFDGQLFLSLQTQYGTVALTFSEQFGFKTLCKVDSSTLLQTLPISSDSNQGVLLATYNDKSVTLTLLSSTECKSYTIGDTTSIAVFQKENCIIALTSNQKYTFCTHLDLLLKENLEHKHFENAKLSILPTNGNEMFVFAETATSTSLYSITNQTSKLFDFGKISQNNKLLKLQNSLLAIVETNECNDYSYTSFGMIDVFLIEIDL